jgi:phosphate transport system protein
VRRDADEARLLPAMDEPVDRLNRDMYQEVVKAGSDPARLEWAIKAMMVSRALERVGDQVVDIGEQLAFLLTGEMAEFDESGLGRSDVQPG